MDATTSAQLLECWRDVSNAGGAVGFPYLPVTDEQVGASVTSLVASLNPQNRLLLATVDHDLAGWLLLASNEGKLAAHWAKVLRVQTALDHRGSGVGGALMREVARAARDDLQLQQLHLELRAGEDLEGFYSRLGWRETGRWPGALHLGGDDFRDEILMFLPLR